MRKKYSASVLILLTLLLFLGACSSFPPPDENRLFRRFTMDLFRQEAAADTVTLHYTLENPESFGIQEPPVSLGTFRTSGSSYGAGLENCLALLDRFRYKKLNRQNQLTYDVLKYTLETALEGSAYPLYDEPLCPLTGVQAQLPVLLSEYSFRSPRDLDTYLSLLESIPDYFDSLIAFEQAKSRAGLFMSSRNARAIILECSTFTAQGKDHYLYSSFRSRLEDVGGLSDTQKEAYIAGHDRIIKTCVFPSYNRLAAALSALKNTGRSQNGLCYLPDGKRYYEFIVRRDTGSSRTIPQLQNLTREQIQEDLAAMQSVAAGTDSTGFLLPDTAPESIVASLEASASGYFPPLPDVNIEIKYVDKEMEEFLSPAFYLVPPLDHQTDNVIYINRGHLPDDLTLYTTLAHEGYPGHLFQHVYYASTGPDPLRTLLSFGGYTEGWATYVEMLSYYFTDLEPDQALLEQRNASVILGLYALADMGIHYDGWTLSETAALFGAFGIKDTGTLEEIYDLITADPGNYLKYYIGYAEFLDLKRTAVKEWGKDFSQKKFHKIILDTGPAPFSVLEQAVRMAS